MNKGNVLTYGQIYQNVWGEEALGNENNAVKCHIRNLRDKLYAAVPDARDAIQDLKEAALKNEFDILLVFMFDRIGRIDDETPFVVEWFAKQGIEVWSTQEGQQRFDNHVDKLMNYLRFWQASGESEKTSIRISSKM